MLCVMTAAGEGDTERTEQRYSFDIMRARGGSPGKSDLTNMRGAKLKSHGEKDVSEKTQDMREYDNTGTIAKLLRRLA